MPEPQATAVTSISYRGITKPSDRIAGRVPTPGPHGRPGTPNPPGSVHRPRTPTALLPYSKTMALRLGSLDSSTLKRQRSQIVKERYQQLEEQSRAQRPLMLPSIRSFSYEFMPTHEAEMEAMIRAESSSPRGAKTMSPASCSELP